MAQQQVSVNIRVEKDVKEQADFLFSKLGFTISTAFNAFIRQAIQEQGLPFQPKLKRISLEEYLEEYHGKPIETVLQEARERNSIEKPVEIDWGESVGGEIW